jgi:8-oxo-dGTP pyrophosphatase MutT (NUDIX family)
MIASGHREIACAVLLDPHGRFLLQRRDNVPNILYPGRIGLFGGHREGDETFLQCVVREVSEETGYLAPPERFEHLGSYVGPDLEMPNSALAGHYYVLRGVFVEALIVTEGSLLVLQEEELAYFAQEFAPSVIVALRMLTDKQGRELWETNAAHN